MIIYCPYCNERYDIDEPACDTTLKCVVCKNEFTVEKQRSNLCACPDCGNMISQRAVFCPHCGYCRDYGKLLRPEVKVVSFQPETTDIFRVTAWALAIAFLFAFAAGFICGIAGIRII